MLSCQSLILTQVQVGEEVIVSHDEDVYTMSLYRIVFLYYRLAITPVIIDQRSTCNLGPD